MRIREATAADDDLVAAMRVRFLSAHRGVEALPHALVQATRAWVTETTAAGELRSWLAEDDADGSAGACVGVVSLVLHRVPPHPEHRGTWEGFVINMFVDPTCRGRGIGRALLAALHEAAGRQQLRRLTLHATPAGRPMYEQLGFAGDPTWMQLDL